MALQWRNRRILVGLGVDRNTTVVFPALLMSPIAELGAFLACGDGATQPQIPVVTPLVVANGNMLWRVDMTVPVALASHHQVMAGDRTRQPELPHRMGAHWRAVNLLSVGQLYLRQAVVEVAVGVVGRAVARVGHWATARGHNSSTCT